MTLTDCGEEKPRRFRHATYLRAVGRALDSTCWSKAEVQLRCPARVSYFPNLPCIGRLSRIGQPTHAALNTDQTNGPRGAISCLSASLAFSLSISSIFLRCLSRSNSSVSIWEMSLPMASRMFASMSVRSRKDFQQLPLFVVPSLCHYHRPLIYYGNVRCLPYFRLEASVVAQTL